jgi:murein DD-endopeptidase MepM/ murein hydrolase activator NlpD
MSIEKHISRIFEEIESSKNSINEILSGSEELFGGAPVRIPRDGAHAGQSGWASGNAWDIAGGVGTPVYAIAAGQATTFRDYGDKVIARNGKKLFGQSFTVKSYDGLPDVYYTHLMGSPIRKGSEVKCGEFLGMIMDFPGSSYDHVHIGVESGNIRQFLNNDGTLKCATGEDIIGTLLGGDVLGAATLGAAALGTTALGAVALSDKEESEKKPEEFEFAGGMPKEKDSDFEFAGSRQKDPVKENYLDDNIDKKILKIYDEINKSKKSIIQSVRLNEDTVFSSPLSKLDVTSGFGPRWGRFHNGVDLKANDEKVKSPADGLVTYTADNEYPCGGTIKIKHSNGYSTAYCHIQRIDVKKGQLVKKGDIIGITGGGAGDPGRGRSDGPHLHFVLKKDDVPIDPMKFLDKDALDIGDILGGDVLGAATLGATALGSTALGAVALSDKEESEKKPEEFEFAGGMPKEKDSDFEFAGSKQKDSVKENIERIKKML